MPRCDTCGNDYADSFEVVTPAGDRFTFDCFECAIHELAPECGHCGCRIIGHGIDGGTMRYCCAHCAREAGEVGAKDNTAQP